MDIIKVLLKKKSLIEMLMHLLLKGTRVYIGQFTGDDELAAESYLAADYSRTL